MLSLDDVDAAVRATTSGVDRCDDASWKGRLENGATLWTTARVESGWLLLATPASLPPDGTIATIAAGTIGASAAQLLEWNGLLHGGARFALLPDDVVPELRAEVPLDDGVDLGPRVAEACAGFMEAAALLRRESWHDHRGANDLGAPPPARDIVATCRDTGWSFTERSPRRLAVELDVPGTYRVAIVEDLVDDEGTVRVSVAFENDRASLHPSCRAAVSTLLLQAGATIRFARAVVTTDIGDPTGFECVFFGGATAAELTHAFAALSVASRFCADEVRVLRHDVRLAERFLALRADYTASTATIQKPQTAKGPKGPMTPTPASGRLTTPQRAKEQRR